MTIKLPRLAYESNKDETYFRAKLAILLQTGINALISRKEHVKESLTRELLPAISQLPVVSSIEDMPLVLNMVGLNEAVSSLVSEREPLSRQEISLKILETASKVSSEKAEKVGQRAFVSMVKVDDLGRLAEIDSERYGRSQQVRGEPYVAGLSMSAVQLDNLEMIASFSALSKATNGGCVVNVTFPKESNIDVPSVVAGLSGKVPFARFTKNPDICRKCGTKVFSGGRCNNCRSSSLISQAALFG